MSNHNHTLVLPFLTVEPLFAYGVEIGLLYARMTAPDADSVWDYFTLWNQDHVLLLASRLGWEVDEVTVIDEHWFWIRMHRKVSA